MLANLWRSPLKKARQAARSEKWAEAARFYRKHLDRHPADSAAWVQLGHGLKEQGELYAALAAYRHATEEQPDHEDGWIYVARIERQLGNRDAAIETLGQGLEHNPDAPLVIAEMLAMGQRDRLPIPVQIEIEKRDGCYSLARYGAYRASHAFQDGNTSSNTRMDVLPAIDGRAAAAELISVTLESLGNTPCLILSEASAPLADLTHVLEESQIGAIAPTVTRLLLVEAGSRVEPTLIQRLCEAMDRTGAAAAYCDHDHWEPTATGIAFCDPCFQPMPDPIWFKRAEVRPPCMIVAREAVGCMMRWGDLFSERMSLPATYVHVPRVLVARRAGVSPLSAPSAALDLPVGAGGIQVIVQTRDAPDMLERCIASLLRTAARPDLLDIVIMDNRSILPETAGLLRNWSEQGIARTIAHDEPFNWARANNLAVPLGQAPHLLFLNNDVEMDSAGWDIVLRDYLAQDQVGAIGALLLYPNRLIQHAGVVFGMGTGGPVHEGVGRRSDQGGPEGRWHQPRLAVAVTGAWLATSRDLFEAVGGFEERLPVAYNDIDFCLRCREVDRLVVQASEILALHHESATRGATLSAAAYARDQAEWAWLQERWGEALKVDPAYNPHWVRTGQPFDGFGTPSNEAVARWIEASARRRPWSLNNQTAPS